MPNQPVAEQQPVFLRQQLHQRELDFFRRPLRDKSEPTRQPHRVRVHDDADDHVKRISQNDVRRLATDTVERVQFLHRARHFAAVPLDELAAAVLDVLRLAAEKSGGLDELLQLRARRIREIRRRAVFFEQLRRDEVDALVRALGGKNDGDEQLERVCVIQFAMRVGISLLETGDDFFQPRGFNYNCFAHQSEFCSEKKSFIIGKQTKLLAIPFSR